MDILRALLIVSIPIVIFAMAALLARVSRVVFRRWRITLSFWLLIGALSIKICLLLTPQELVPQRIDAFSDALIFFAGSLLIAALLITLIFDYMLIRTRRIEVPNLIRQIIVFGVSFVLLTIFLKTFFAFDLTPIIATSAVLSMVLGLALQDLLKKLLVRKRLVQLVRNAVRIPIHKCLVNTQNRSFSLAR